MRNKIKVGILLSYDYEFAITCLHQLYEFVDTIYLVFDKDNLTWAGKKFDIPNSFFEEIENFDRDNKIVLYRDSFYVPENTAMQNETRERNMLVKKMGSGWQIQIDCDEYLYDFKVLKSFIKRNNYLANLHTSYQITLKGILVTLFKKTKNGFLYIENNETCPLLYNYQPIFGYGRESSGDFKNTGFKMIHQSWARDEDQMLKKIKNWGHNTDFDTEKYLEFWKTLDENNYTTVKNFHPIKPEVWNNLKYIQAENIDEFIEKYAQLNPQKVRNVFTLTDKYKLYVKHFLKKNIKELNNVAI